MNSPSTTTLTGRSLQPPTPLFPELTGQEYEQLRDDVAARGVLVPVEVCGTTGQVLDGRARVRACLELGIARYPRIVRAGLETQEQRDAHTRALNVLRRHLSPAERAGHVRALRVAGWSSRRIAAATGLSQTTVTRDLQAAAGEPDGSPARVVGADGKAYPARRAFVLVDADGEQDRASTALRLLGTAAPGKALELRRAERLVRDQAAAARRPGTGPVLPDGARVEHCAAADLQVEPGSVALVLCDPPYDRAGIDAGVYDDLGRLAATALAPGGLLIAYAGQQYLPQALAALEAHLSYWWLFAAVHDAGSGIGQVRQRNLGNAFKPLVCFRKAGGEGLPPWTLDVVRSGRRQKESGHPWEQPECEAAELIVALTRPGDTVLDPFCGSGPVPAAALRTGRRTVACDADERSVALTVDRLSAISG